MQVKNIKGRSSLFICCFTLRKLNQSFCFALGSPICSLILKLFFSDFQLFFLDYDSDLEYCCNYCLFYFFILILYARFLSKSDDDSKNYFSISIIVLHLLKFVIILTLNFYYLLPFYHKAELPSCIVTIKLPSSKTFINIKCINDKLRQLCQEKNFVFISNF